MSKFRGLSCFVIVAVIGCKTPTADIVTEAPAAEPDPQGEVEPEPDPASEPEAKPEPKPRPAYVAVKGLLEREVIMRVVGEHLHEIRSCYDTGLAKDPELQGRVIIDFIIGADGKVTSSVVHESTLKDTDVPVCIARAAETWVFPEPAPGGFGGIVNVRYPFDLVPG